MSQADGPIVVKLGGAALEPSPELDALLAAIVERHRACGVVVVHGGGAAVDRHLARLGITSPRADGLRVTGADHVHEVVAVLAGRVNAQLAAGLRIAGAPAVGLTLGDGGTAIVARHAPDGRDLGCVGRVTGGDGSLVRALMERGALPVFASIGHDARGEPLNVNADDAAAGLALVVGASEVLLMTDVPGVLDAAGRVRAELDAESIATAIESGEITGGMIAKVRGALDAATRAMTPVRISSWREPRSLAPFVMGGAGGTRILPPLDPAAARPTRSAALA